MIGGALAEESIEQERQRELDATIDGFNSPMEYIFDRLARDGNVDHFASFIDYTSSKGMMEDFYEYANDPNDKYWQDLVIDFFA